MRHTRNQTGTRRSHHALAASGTVLCADCGMPKRKHVMCAQCGKYKGKTIIDKKAIADKKAAKKTSAK